MIDRAFRFVHASDLHLERPLSGVGDVPAALRESFADAPLRAARKLFDQVLSVHADFLVLSGDVIDIDAAGPRVAVFLLEQFERLAAADIAIYWAGGAIDSPDHWPVGLTLPSNVHFFSSARPEEFRATGSGVTLAHLTGWSRPKSRVRAGDYWPDAAGAFSIAVGCGSVERESLVDRGIHYWALGGRHGRATLGAAAPVVHYPGSIQGRSPAETGAHGCTLVDVDSVGPPRLTMLATDVVRWQQQRLVIDETTTRERLEHLLSARIDELLAVNAGLDLLVSWTIGGSGPLLRQLGRGPLGAEILSVVQRLHGNRTHWAYSHQLIVEPATPAEARYEEDTILGEFLRTVREQQTADDAETIDALDLESLLSERHAAGVLAEAVRFDDSHGRSRVLAEAAALGTDLLGGEEE